MSSPQPAALSLATRRASLRGLYGQGEAGHAPLLLLPGITSPAATLSFFVDVLRRHGLAGHTLILDHRGLGCSRAHGSKIAFQDYVDDVIAWLDHVSFSQPIGVGHSLGAKILAAVDVQASGRIASRILIDPPMSGPGRRPYP